MHTEPLIVGIDARLRSGQVGGVEQFVIGLASGLADLTEGTERYLFLTLPGEDEWLRPYMRGPCAIAPQGLGRRARQWVSGTLPRRAVEVAPWLRTVRGGVRNAMGVATLGLPRSDGTLESAGASVIHLPLQTGLLSDIPTIYHPWDLQHLHLPDLFPPDVVAAREHRYRSFCARASLIVVATDWARNDLVEKYGIDHGKIEVIPVPPPLMAYPRISDGFVSEVRNRLSLPPRFILYPAQTWRHKNHVRLLQALDLVRRRYGVEIPVVCSGRRNDYYPTIAQEVSRLNLGKSVSFVGFVTQDEIQALFRSSTALVFPSLFEGWGLPVVEAFAEEVPVACSHATSLPELVADAALLFDPFKPDEIAEAIWRLWTDDSLRRTLVVRGKVRVRDLNWTDTARAFRAHYRAVSHGPYV